MVFHPGIEQTVLGNGIMEAFLPNISDILTLPADVLLEHLGSSLSGLSSEEAERRLRVFGYNEVAGRRKRSLIIEFLYHFRNPLTIILLVA
ncbi:MAG: cation-transporting P-type ATPase, partial [Candidatus Bathyarchaeia archaeon]